jgi:endonuclease/exonuclease/phosphatase family metal-dependent hydrolase
LKKIAAKAYQKEIWTSNYMMIRIGNLIVINVYVSEGWKREIINTVTNLSRQCVTDGLDVMVMGDFNLIPEEMEKVARRNALKLCPSPIEGTREGRNGSRNTLDYVMHNFDIEVTPPEIIPQLSTSDHELLLVTTTR